jgi:type IV pilus assembly protein PilW
VTKRSHVRHQRGVTLVELMVALLIGLVITLAVSLVMTSFEGRRRTHNATSDLEKAGALALMQIDRRVRSAGAGLAGTADYAYGCSLHAVKGATQILPAGTLVEPFDSVNPGASGVFRLAPVLILPGQTTPAASGQASDVLVLMSSGAAGSVPAMFSSEADDAEADDSKPDGDALHLDNTVAFSANDLVLISSTQSSADGGVAPCLISQVSSAPVTDTSTALKLSGAWHQSTVGDASLEGFANAGTATVLGNVSLGRPPEFVLMGVGDHNSLFTYDLLQTADTPLQAVAEGVFELHALYGVDNNSDDIVDAWVSPSDTGAGYRVADLSNGSADAAAKLKNIKALRIGLILRTSLPERDEVSGDDLKLFEDLGDDLKYTRKLSAEERRYRYRTLESTIPVRNHLP